MLEQITESVVSWGSGFGLFGLALVSASEAVLQPVPPDLLVIPMSLEAESNFVLLAIFLVSTISSVIGSLGGYAIGNYVGRPAIDRFAKPTTSRKLDELISRYGDAGVFIAAVSPIPYKLLAWTAGSGRMDLRTFVFAGLFGRGIRFGLEILLIGYWGDEFVKMLEEPIFWIVICVFSLAVFVPVKSWWESLDSPV
ncbi:MAG TPA: VTT domain-containing protein [Candidatus Thalassarchaeaceae archaeon]|mgnify:CR=1 FL=1|jgi:undecaprenyl-diphosphatase|nr:VTT domain-containing protein [Candidatus Thalassarchaeaceae archaeon]